MAVCYIPMGRAGSIWHNSSMHDINHESDSCLLQWYLCNWVHCVFHVLPHNKIFWVPKSEQQISLLLVLLWYKSKSVWCNTVMVSLHMISTLAKCIRLIFSTLWPTLKIGYWLGVQDMDGGCLVTRGYTLRQLLKITCHDDIMTWIYFPNYGPLTKI